MTTPGTSTAACDAHASNNGKPVMTMREKLQQEEEEQEFHHFTRLNDSVIAVASMFITLPLIHTAQDLDGFASTWDWYQSVKWELVTMLASELSMMVLWHAQARLNRYVKKMDWIFKLLTSLSMVPMMAFPTAATLVNTVDQSSGRQAINFVAYVLLGRFLTTILVVYTRRQPALWKDACRKPQRDQVVAGMVDVTLLIVALFLSMSPLGVASVLLLGAGSTVTTKVLKMMPHWGDDGSDHDGGGVDTT
ncbi:MAG: hypothetical protein SGARI_003414 [Bacillariaceae sp.]